MPGVRDGTGQKKERNFKLIHCLSAGDLGIESGLPYDRALRPIPKLTLALACLMENLLCQLARPFVVFWRALRF
jgi:hypothetical protein